MLWIQRQGEQYFVYLLSTGNQPARSGLAPKSFLGKKSLAYFLLNILQIPQELIDRALEAHFVYSIPLSPEQMARWSA